jgi:hypothetical protein
MRVARPLAVLVPLIREDLKHGQDVAERAGLRYYEAAGEKLLEAKAQLSDREFEQWMRDHVQTSRVRASRYIRLAEDAQKSNPLNIVIIARPLSTLAALINQDLKHGRAAAEDAGRPYYEAAGEKLLEAKDQIPDEDFVQRTFQISPAAARRYLRFAESKPKYYRPAWWPEAVKPIVPQIDTQRLNLVREDLKRKDERQAERTLALQMIDMGYKVLARKLHPDKGGSREAMARLNAVRARHKQLA